MLCMSSKHFRFFLKLWRIFFMRIKPTNIVKYIFAVTSQLG